MSLHITRFIDRLRAAESRQQRDVTLTVHEARDLHAEITRLLLELQALRSRGPEAAPSGDVTRVEITGGSFR